MNRIDARRPLRVWLTFGLSRIPGRYGVGIIPWLVSLLFSAGSVSVPTAGPYEAQWIRAAIIISLCASLAQGIAVLLVRPRARRLPPTIAGGLSTLAVFALLGAVGGTVGVIGYHFVDLPDRPGFFMPVPVFVMAVTTWVCVGSIVSISFSWRDHLRDSLAVAAARVAAKHAVLDHSLELDARQRTVAIRTLTERVIPQLRLQLIALRTPAAAGSERDGQRNLIADRIEHIARHDIRGVSHLLHPDGATPDLASALADITRLYDPLVELRVLHDSVQAPVPASVLCEAAVALAEALSDLSGEGSTVPATAVARQSATSISLVIERGPETRRVELPIMPVPPPDPTSNASPKWYRVAPAPYGMPWVAISIINAFSVLFATANAGTGKWAAAGADIAVITIGTYGLDLLLRLAPVRRWRVRSQWLLIGGYVGALGALAGAVWGTAIGGETISLAVMGLICAFSMGMFLPARRVWSGETRRLRQELRLTELSLESETVTAHAHARDQCEAAANALHSIVQSRLLGIAGSVDAHAPDDLRSAAITTLADLIEQELPDIVASLQATATPQVQPLLTEQMLKTVWPATQLHVSATAPVPQPAVPLINTLIVEAIGNAIAHGRADEISVTATVWPGAVELTIDDNGTGVPPHAQRGLGLSVMQAATSDCSLTARSAGGTRLHLRVPYLA